MTTPLRSRFLHLATLAAALLAFSAAHAQLTITEAMSSSGSTGDWFELTNLGASPVDITGYKMDDNSFNFANSVALVGVTSIASHESVVFIESSAPGTDVPAFRTFWGNISGIQVGTYSGSGVSLSSSADGVEVFKGDSTVVSQISFGTATSGVSFGYNSNTDTFGALSVDGQFGAFTSANAIHNIGSPGSIGLAAVPEPGAYALWAGVAALGLLGYARKQKKCVA